MNGVAAPPSPKRPLGNALARSELKMISVPSMVPDRIIDRVLVDDPWPSGCHPVPRLGDTASRRSRVRVTDTVSDGGGSALGTDE